MDLISGKYMKLTPELEREIAELDAPIFSPVCTFCIHKNGARKCEAFPVGIPLEIWTGENNHTTAIRESSLKEFK